LLSFLKNEPMDQDDEDTDDDEEYIAPSSPKSEATTAAEIATRKGKGEALERSKKRPLSIDLDLDASDPENVLSSAAKRMKVSAPVMGNSLPKLLPGIMGPGMQAVIEEAVKAGVSIPLVQNGYTKEDVDKMMTDAESDEGTITEVCPPFSIPYLDLVNCLLIGLAIERRVGCQCVVVSYA
jgi:hypothetical protein